MADFNIVVRTYANLHPTGEPADFIVELDALITCTDESSGNRTNVGRIRAQRVGASLAADREESLFDVCDSHSHELHELHALLYEPVGYSFREPLMTKFAAVDTDLLVLDYVVMHPRWRRLRLGLLAVRKFVDLAGAGCGLAVALIAPLRRRSHKDLGLPRSWIPPQTSSEARRASVAKLRGYFRRMGFRRLARTEFYVLPLGQRTPTAEELLRPEGQGGG